MHCYFCRRAEIETLAVALCQACGAGCCLDHLEECAHAGHGPGMLPMQSPRVEILCLRCLALQTSIQCGAALPTPAGWKTGGTPPARAGRETGGTSHTATPLLPDVAEAIASVESLLGLPRASAPEQQSSRGWRRFFGRGRS